MKQEIHPFDCAGQILKAMPKGILLTTKSGDKVNTMTIGWGHIGIEWGKPIFIAFVRENRYTRQMLDENGEFTVNIPWEGECREILSYCGTKSGRNTDKIRDLQLHLEEPLHISVPGIRELPLTLECKVIYRQVQDLSAITENLRIRYYPREVGSDHPGSNQDVHIAYYGEILSAYTIVE